LMIASIFFIVIASPGRLADTSSGLAVSRLRAKLNKG